MKAQMKFQKILSLLTIIAGAIVFVYALCFFSGNLSDLMYYKSENLSARYAEYCEWSDTFIYSGQTFVTIFVALGIVYICAAAFLYVTSSNSRRNYYVTNYVSVGIVIAVTAVAALLGIIFISVLMSQFYAIGIDCADTGNDIGYLYSMMSVLGAPEVSNSPVMFILGYVVCLIALANAAAWALNLVLKIKLMKGEKALLANGLVKEVA